MAQSSDIDKYLEFLCWKGLEERGLSNNKIYVDRLSFELETIFRMGFSSYFLILYDALRWAREQRIPCGAGRGSAAGSLVAYLTRITKVDPIRFGLIFERFLNPGRVGSPPDIDQDISKAHRDIFINYLIDTYGEDRVVHIGTIGTYKGKASVRAVARALGYSYEIGDELSKLLLGTIHGKYQSISESISKVEELKNKIEKDPVAKEIIENSLKIEDLASSLGIHASGVIISEEPIVNKIPLFLGKGKEVASQLDMRDVEALGYIKFDFLGLETLTKIWKCLKIIEERTGKLLDIDLIELDDDAIYSRLRSGDTIGLFQLESSSGIKNLLIQIAPRNLKDLSALIAIFRPGPLQSTEVANYLEVRAGRKEPSYLFPELEKHLLDTNGLLIYQEQVINIAKDLAGYTLAEADGLRKAIGKKDEKEMKLHTEKFISGLVNKGIDKEKASELWKQILAFADYSFNLAHSLCYALTSYQTAWLKTYYPLEWMTSLLICEQDNQDQVIRYIAECRRIGIQVLPPDINESSLSFSIAGNSIRFGLSAIKNIGQGPVDLIIEERNRNGRFISLENFIDRVGVGSKLNSLRLQCLIEAGAFDFQAETRASLLSYITRYCDFKEATKSFEAKQKTYDKKVAEYHERLRDIENGKLSSSGAKLKPLKFPEAPQKEDRPLIERAEEISILDLIKREKELLGFYVTDHPLNFYKRPSGSNYLQIEDLLEIGKDAVVSILAVISSKKENVSSKTKKTMAYLNIEDKTGHIEVVAFPQVYDSNREMFSVGEVLEFNCNLKIIETDDAINHNLIVRSAKKPERKAVSTNIDKKLLPMKELNLSGDISMEDFSETKVFIAESGTRFYI